MVAKAKASTIAGMANGRQEIGRRGEAYAAAFLRVKGFRVIAQNWRCRFGEIDLIVQRGEEVRFVEVKTRFTERYGHPEEAVTTAKLGHLRHAVECWLGAHPFSPKKYQIDVLAILVKAGSKPEVHWVEGAL